MKQGDVRKGLRRGIYVIPTSFTVLNLFFGFRSIVNSIRALEMMANARADIAITFFEHACWALFIAAIFDTFDGLVARQLGATSEFGKEYDSLADVVTFGAAPAVLVYAWALHILGNLGAGFAFLFLVAVSLRLARFNVMTGKTDYRYFVGLPSPAVLVYAWALHILGNLGAGFAFLFLVAVSLRLARFNVMTGKTDYRYFVGLPSPAGALTIAAIVNYGTAPVNDRQFAIVILIVTAAVAFAMVSPIRWRSQKGLSLQKERSLMYFLVFAVLIAILISWPKESCFVGAILYLASGPLIRLWAIAFPSRKVDNEVLAAAP